MDDEKSIAGIPTEKDKQDRLLGICSDTHTSKLRDSRGARLQKYARFKEGHDYERMEVSSMLEMMALAQANIEDFTRKGHGAKYENIGDFLKASHEYFGYLADCAEDKIFLIPDIEGFCVFIGIDRMTLFRWEKMRGATWSDAIQNIKNQISAVKKQLALTGKIPPMVFAIDQNNNHDYVQQQKLTVEVLPQLTDGLETADAIAERYLKNVIDITPSGEKSEDYDF